MQNTNQLYYPNPDGTIQLGNVVAPPPGKEKDWKLCVIKIEDNHFGMYTGEAIMQSTIKAEA